MLIFQKEDDQMVIEIDYLKRINGANEQLAREIKELSILLQEATRLLAVIAKNTKKDEMVIDNVSIKNIFGEK